jgi:hypothetical protein
MKQQVLEAFLPPLFLWEFDKEKKHNMLAFMFDPRSKTCILLTFFFYYENVAIVIVAYGQKLLFPLLIEAHKLLMPTMST